MTKLIITLDHDTNAFTYALSYTDASGTAYISSVPENGIVAFTNSGQYELKDGAGTPRTFTFDEVEVVLGLKLRDLPQKACDGGPFHLASIVFPTIPADGNSAVAVYCWCQATSSGETLVFKDPKLGLSNTTGNSPAPAPVFTSCGCT